MNAPSAAPVRKVAAGGLAGAVVTIGVYIVDMAMHTSVPDYVSAALVLVASFVIAYLVPASASEVNP